MSRQREREPVVVVRVVDRQSIKRDAVGWQRRAEGRHSQRERRRERIVPRRQSVARRRAFRSINEDRIAAANLDAIVAVARVDPDRLLHRRPDGDLVVAIQRVDQDDLELSLRWQQRTVQRQRRGLQRLQHGGRSGDVAALHHRLQVIEVQRFERIPNRVAVLVGRVDVEFDLRREREVAVVVRQPRDEMMIGQHARFGHEIDVDLVIRVRAADVPDFVLFASVRLPVAAAESTVVHRIQRRAVGSEQHIAAAVAEQEINRRAAE